MRLHSFRGVALAALCSVAAACESATEPVPAPVQIRVTNSTCTPGPCVPIRVFAFPVDQGFNAPAGPWRFEVGTVTTSTACLTIPATRERRLIQEHSSGTADTLVFRWGSTQPVRLGLIFPDESVFQASPSTPEFSPMDAAGWTTTLPGEARPVAAAACQP